jgi:hypothetical protein
MSSDRGAPGVTTIFWKPEFLIQPLPGSGLQVSVRAQRPSSPPSVRAVPQSGDVPAGA